MKHIHEARVQRLARRDLPGMPDVRAGVLRQQHLRGELQQRQARHAVCAVSGWVVLSWGVSASDPGQRQKPAGQHLREGLRLRPWLLQGRGWVHALCLRHVLSRQVSADGCVLPSHVPARGYFRDPPSDELSFNCSLCIPGDFCFNNSAYNCSDALMQSAPGSGFVDNCTCASRFYNNGSRCEDCPVDHYCVMGQRLACQVNEWTGGLERAETCVCQPGFFPASRC